ncbi:uncharacterized protein CLUP02_16302 [Colletotrichum lupini]|uniref:Uncharacterized protein n=1 Tax=Colletotrichum lupini TaxID=145971 RepID=A0A9Q8WPU8_9PEZI|nr:uncharacterized protein CLUP02_16302 [Colletotrichum lupini]UQC90772.1 hypothetical protein CLUP02_16302 [Colletotrichum lupini]
MPPNQQREKDQEIHANAKGRPERPPTSHPIRARRLGPKEPTNPHISHPSLTFKDATAQPTFGPGIRGISAPKACQTLRRGGQNTAHAHTQTATGRRIDPLEPSILNPQSSTRRENPYQSFNQQPS